VRGRAAAYVAEFERVVAPILVRAGVRRYLDDAVCDVSTKLSFLLASYAATAGVRFRADLAVLGGVVARVYDDLVDTADEAGDALDARVAALFRGEEPAPGCERERLLHALYRELERRLGRDRGDPVYAALLALHDHQVRSRGQRDPAIGAALLADITCGKGGHAMVVFVGLIHPALTERQVLVVRELGVVLQLLDDYVDVAADRRAGITTPATRRELALADICRRLRALAPALRACYGRGQPLFAVLYLNLWLAFLRRSFPRWPERCRPFRVLVRIARRRVRAVGTPQDHGREAGLPR
jgi:hypothetical protein